MKAERNNITKDLDQIIVKRIVEKVLSVNKTSELKKLSQKGRYRDLDFMQFNKLTAGLSRDQRKLMEKYCLRVRLVNQLIKITPANKS